MNTPTSIFRSAYGSKTVLALRMGYIREDGERASKKTFNSRNGKPVLLALGTIALVPFEAIRVQSHGSTGGYAIV